ncbi:hypothetical protein RIF29_16121 [Crotalaria pallida]|uniref:DUF4220 domain-containing protein n=1 Tax=Crotalaria pallida TaxID=3830 RepID=A0AAN9FFV2_CROPI
MILLLPIIASWVSVEGHRRLVQVVPEPAREFWDKWELRGLVFVSLVSQVILTVLGNRKTRRAIWSRALAWSSYLMADWVATVALGAISSKLGDYYDKQVERVDENIPQLIAFWAPFFLIHLGGPNTITAYALEDNELWSRHALGCRGLGVSTELASTIFKDSVLPSPSKPAYCLKDQHVEVVNYSDTVHNKSRDDPENLSQHQYSHQTFMKLFVSLFKDVVFTLKDIKEDQEQFRGMEFEDAFKKVDRELGFAYDVFYTKASTTHTKWGRVLRFFIWIATMVVIVIYIVSVQQKNHLQAVDHVITYMLLAWAVLSDTCAIMMMFAKRISNLLPKKLEIHLSSTSKMLPSGWTKIGSNSLSQCNFIRFCIDHTNNVGYSKSLRKFLKHRKITCSNVDSEMKELIFTQLRQKFSKMHYVYDQAVWKESLVGISAWINIIERMDSLEFHQTIIAWNIVTQLCYYYDESPKRTYKVKREASKKLYDYMFHLLVECRYMLPIGTGLVTLADTFVEAKQFLRPASNSEENELCSNLDLLHLTFPDTSCYDPTRSLSVFTLACKVAQLLLKKEHNSKMWEYLTEQWMEILAYAACYCRVDHHAQHLRRGGEFLTHAWLLQAHLGVLEKFQSSGANLLPTLKMESEDNLLVVLLGRVYAGVLLSKQSEGLWDMYLKKGHLTPSSVSLQFQKTVHFSKHSEIGYLFYRKHSLILSQLFH